MKNCMRAIGAAVLLVELMLTGHEALGQDLGSPQAQVLHQSEDYRILAMPLSPGQAIVRLTHNGILSPILVVQPFDVMLQSTGDRRTALDNRDRDPRLRRGDSSDEFASGGLAINGTEQRILGVAFDDRFMYAAVAGYARSDASVVAHGVSDEGGTAENSRATGAVRLMVHVYNHATTARVLSYPVEVSDSFELGHEDLSRGPLRLIEGGVECLQTELLVESDRSASVRDRQGRVRRLETEAQRLRMRSI